MKSGAWSRVAMPAVLLAAIAGGAVLAMEPELTKIHAKIERDYDNVEHIDAEAFSALNRDRVVVFDVRKEGEYDVSHIEGAVRVDPGVSPDAFFDAHGNALRGKTAVFYCSVGRRSSALASRVNDLVETNGATGSYNLVGGLFQWRNEERTLVREGGATTAIHPYNIYWGRLISDKSAIRYAPKIIPSRTQGD